MNKYLRYGLMLIAVLLLWDSLVVQPLKLFASYVHQCGHYLMSAIFSYAPADISISLTSTTYKIIHQKSLISAFFIGNAGYLVSVMFAFFILYLKDKHVQKYLPGVFTIFMLFITIKFNGSSEQLIYAAIFAATAIAVHMIANDNFNHWVLELIAISNLAFVLYDLVINVLYYEFNLYFKFSTWKMGTISGYSDALQLQTLTHIPAVVWGILWICGIIIYTVVAMVNDVASQKK